MAKIHRLRSRFAPLALPIGRCNRCFYIRALTRSGKFVLLCRRCLHSELLPGRVVSRCVVCMSPETPCDRAATVGDPWPHKTHLCDHCGAARPCDFPALPQEQEATG